MNVSVDPNQCALTGYCVRIAPEVFVIDDDAAVVRVADDVAAAADESLRQAVEEAETTCPTRAISYHG